LKSANEGAETLCPNVVPSWREVESVWQASEYQEHGHLLYGLRTDFALDSLRSDPRYAELVRKIGLPQ